MTSAIDSAIAALNVDRTPHPLTGAERGAILSWPGWGALAPAFEHQTTGRWANLADNLEDLIDAEGLAVARDNLDTSFFTPRHVIDTVFRLLTATGFTSGRVLEPGCGTGRFMAVTPTNLTVDWTGVEIDPTSAAMARLVNPDANIITAPIQRTAFLTGEFDAVIGNVPFSSATVFDPAFPSANLHEYFLMRALDAVREGGYVIIVTSRHMMDSRRGLSGIAAGRLIAALRLPSGTFAAEGTDVVADILMFRKPVTGEPDLGWDDETENGTIDTGYYSYGRRDKPTTNRPTITEPATTGKTFPQEINAYWAKHPGHVAGRLRVNGNPRSPLVVISDDPATDIDVAVHAARAHIIPQAERRAISALTPLSDVPLADADGRKEGSFHIIGSRIRQVSGGTLVDVRDSKELRALIGLRDAGVALLALESDPQLADEKIVEVRSNALALYLAYYESFGALNRGIQSEGKPDPETGEPTHTWRRPTLGGFRLDPDYLPTMALEQFSQDDGTAEPSPILRRRVNRHPIPVTRVDTAEEALAVSLGEGRDVDLARIGGLLGLATDADTIDALGDLVFDDGRDLVAARDYLTGNVRQKLADARRKALTDDSWAKNVRALEAVLPRDRGPLEIGVSLGAPWVSAADITQFAREILSSHITLVHTPEAAVWEIERAANVFTPPNVALVYGTPKITVIRILECALNGKSPAITKSVWVKDHYVDRRDTVATIAAEEKLKAMDDRFSLWLWEDPERTKRVCREFNDRFNSHVIRRPDGAYLTFPGLAANIEPWTQQKDAVDRNISTERTLIGHPVGSGKTLEIILTAMTLRRFGLATKPLIAVPNHLLEQVTREAQQAFPTGRFLIATKEDLTKDRRRLFAARCATGDWDAVIMTHAAFGSIAVSPDAEAEWVERQKSVLRTQMGGLPERWGVERSKGAKAIARGIRSLETRIDALRHGQQDTEQVRFDQLGIDYLMIDECFPYSTLVDTDHGRLPIGQIVDEALDVRIASVDLKTGTTEYKKIHRWVKKATDGRLIHIKHETGALTCTPNHPIWVEGHGYIRAEEIVAGQTLRILPGDLHTNDRSESVLQRETLGAVSGTTALRLRNLPGLRRGFHSSFSEPGGVQRRVRRDHEASTTPASVNVLDLRDGISVGEGGGSILLTELQGQSPLHPKVADDVRPESMYSVQELLHARQREITVLHRLLRDPAQCSAEVRTPGLRTVWGDLPADAPESEVLREELRESSNNVRGSWSGTSSTHANDAHQGLEYPRGARKVERTNEGEQPHDGPGNTREDGCFDAGANLLVTRWKRSDDGSTETAGGEVGAADGVLYSDPASLGSVRVSAEFLRRRLGVRGGEVGNRSGWEDAQTEEVEVPGQAENRDLGSSRVVSVEVLERRGSERNRQGSAGDPDSNGFVYNLEVEDNHNYFADGVLVSNCHLYRRLDTGSTSRDNGFSSGSSKRATDLLLKIELLALRYPNKPIVSLFTGTPWANTLAETWTWQRYLQPERLAETGTLKFDAWVAAFIKYETAVEVSPDGSGFRVQRRPVGVKNWQQLRTMMWTVADIVSADSLNLPRPEVTVHTRVAQPTPEQKTYVTGLADRADDFRNRTNPDSTDSMLLICGDGRKAALDPHLIGVDEEGSKLRLVAQEAATIYRENKERLYGSSPVPGALQLVFCDLGTPHPGEAQTYGRLRTMMVAEGIPASKIRFVHEAKTDKARAALFAQCREGSVAVLFGSTSKVGMGTNIQTRLAALHHVDAPWTPAEVTQRDGRGDRPGNLNDHIDIVRYVTEGTFDSYTWQALERKARAFDKLYSDDESVNELEDLSQVVLSYAEVKSLAAGNPLLLDQAKLNSEVQKLRLMRTVHLQGVTGARNAAVDLDERAAAMELRAAVIRMALDAQGQRGPVSDDPYPFTQLGRGLADSRRARSTVGVFVLSAEGTYATVQYQSEALISFVVPPKTIRRGEVPIGTFIQKHFAQWLVGAAASADLLDTNAAGLRARAADNRSAASASIFEEDTALSRALADLARVETEIREEALRYEERSTATAA